MVHRTLGIHLHRLPDPVRHRTLGLDANLMGDPRTRPLLCLLQEGRRRVPTEDPPAAESCHEQDEGEESLMVWTAVYIKRREFMQMNEAGIRLQTKTVPYKKDLVKWLKDPKTMRENPVLLCVTRGKSYLAKVKRIDGEIVLFLEES